MLSKEYIEQLVASALKLGEGTRVFCMEGYDESVAVIQNPRVVDFPAFILEDRAGGTLEVLNGGHDSHTQSIWVMNAVRKGSFAVRSAAALTLICLWMIRLRPGKRRS